MDKSILRKPLFIAVVALVLALIPILIDNENILVLLRLLSFGLFFYAAHLMINQKRKISK